jgi:Zn ribbon nucleic-acid-binding protein
MVITTLTAFCATCRASREIRDWREQADSLLIELEECGHVIRRCSRDEWRLEKAVA